MEFFFVLVVLVVLSWSAGYGQGRSRTNPSGEYKRGKRDGAKEVFKALGVPEGYEIDMVSYRKARK